MSDVVAPTWQLVLDAAVGLSVRSGEFRMAELISAVQDVAPSRGRGSIQPVIQGMTAGVGSGLQSPCGHVFVRLRHGVYAFGTAERRDGTPAAVAVAAASPSGRATRHANEVEARVEETMADFPAFLDAYDASVPFGRVGHYELHRATIDLRMTAPDVTTAVQSTEFCDSLYATLQAWGIGRRASKVVPAQTFQRRLQSIAGALDDLVGLPIDDPLLDVDEVAFTLWELIERLDVVDNISLIVPGTKTLHHLLPDLVPPMDRAWTGAYFAWSAASSQNGQRTTFMRTYRSMAEIARRTDPGRFVGAGWRTSRSKIIDNAIIGYCKLHAIAPRRS